MSFDFHITRLTMSIKFFTNPNQELSNLQECSKNLETPKNLLKKLHFIEREIKSAEKKESIHDTCSLLGRINLIKKACKPHKKLKIKCANLENQIKQRFHNIYMKAIQSQKIEPVKVAKKKSFFSWIPYAGIGLGTLSGLAFRSLGFNQKDPTLCKKVFEDLPIFQAINQIKQTEIKTFSVLVPLLPLIAQIVKDTCKTDDEASITARFTQSLQKHCGKEQIAELSGVFGAMFIAANAKYWMGGFDPSGHMMLKVQLATLTQKTMSTVFQANSSLAKPLSFFLAAYAVTDAVFLHNTASHCHTVSEVAAGLAFGILLSTAAQLTAKMFERKSSSNPE